MRQKRTRSMFSRPAEFIFGVLKALPVPFLRLDRNKWFKTVVTSRIYAFIVSLADSLLTEKKPAAFRSFPARILCIYA